MRVVPPKTKTASLLTLVLLVAAAALSTGTTAHPHDPDTSGEWHGFIGCSVSWPTLYEPFNCPDENNHQDKTFTVEPRLKTLVVAVEWEPAQLCTSDTMFHALYAPADAHGPMVLDRYAESPYEYRIDLGEDFDEIEETTEFRFRANGPVGGVQFCYAQFFDVYFHLFYSEHAPEDYSALP